MTFGISDLLPGHHHLEGSPAGPGALSATAVGEDLGHELLCRLHRFRQARDPERLLCRPLGDVVDDDDLCAGLLLQLLDLLASPADDEADLQITS